MNATVYEDGTYLKNNPTWHEEDSAWKTRQINKILTKNNVKPISVCEIGCGAGEILNCMTQSYGENVDFSGYEISPQAFSICKKKEKPNLKFHSQDLFLQENARFDVVMAIDVFEHVEDYFGFLRKLRPMGTYKVFHIPLDLSVQTVFRSEPIMKGRREVGHIHYFTKDTALATLNDTGYQVIDYAYTSGSLDLPNRGFRANLLKLPRRLLFSLKQDFAVRLLGGFSLMVLAR